jgi:hypothetical protein
MKNKESFLENGGHLGIENRYDMKNN